MKKKFLLVLETIETKSSSHIFLAKQNYEKFKKDLIEGEFHWNTRKADYILGMAHSVYTLIEYKQLNMDQSNICTYISNDLRTSGMSEGVLAYIREVLPQEFKNANMARNSLQSLDTLNALYDPDDEDNPAPVQLSPNQQKNLYQFKHQLKNMSATEIQETYLSIQREDKERRIRTKAKKEAIELESVLRKVPLPFYKKTSAQIPPEELHGVTLLYNKLLELGKIHGEIEKYVYDIAKSVKEFPPSEEKGEEYGLKIDHHIQTFMKVLKQLYVPYTDKKWSGDTVEWMNIQLSRLDHGKNAAGTKHARDTGEIAIKKNKDGSYTYIKLDRDITREQVGDNSEVILNTAKAIIENNPAFMQIMALHDWSYDTFVQEGDLPENVN